MKCLRCLTAPCSVISQRYFFAIYVLLGLNIFFWIRVSTILALSAMTFSIATNKSNQTGNQYCPPSEGHNEDTRTKAEFSWDQHTQHLIIQGFYYGYIVSNVPGGILSDKFGGKTVIGCGYLLASFMAIVLPFLAKISPYCFFAGRIVQGLGQGVIFPSISSMVAKWAPPGERATLTGIVQSGIMIGNASGFLMSSFILAITPTWKEIFYINGVLGILWVIGWYLFCYSSPAQHPFVSDEEKNMIETQLAQSSKRKPKSTPWKKIFTSPPVYAAVIANYGHLWANFTMINEMPSYLSKVVNFDIKGSGVFSATPHLSMIPTTLGTGYLCDWLVRKQIMSVTINRKIFIFLSNALPVPFLIGASLVGCDKVWVVVLFALMMFFKGLAYATLKVQPVDLSPNYAGTLMGILNGTGAISGFVSPMVVPLFITGDGSLQEWRGFFALSGGIMIISTFPFLCFGSGIVQPWNSQEEDVGEENKTDSQQEKENL